MREGETGSHIVMLGECMRFDTFSSDAQTGGSLVVLCVPLMCACLSAGSLVHCQTETSLSGKES